MERQHNYPIHAAIWANDVVGLRQLLKSLPRSSDPRGPGGVDEYDNHGNPPLHLALMLNRKACIDELLKTANPDCRLQSRDGWSPLAEAVSLGNREIIHDVLERRSQQTRLSLKQQMPLVYQKLEQLGDFRLEMHWHFTSWIPFVSNLCPSDTNVIFKKGKCIRFDTTIAGFDRMRWIRGNLSLLVLSDDNTTPTNMSISDMKEFLTRYGISYADCVEKSDLVKRVQGVLQLRANNKATSRYGDVYMLNHDKKVFAVVGSEADSEADIETLINIMMAAERTFTQFNSKKLRHQHAKSGFWGFQSDRKERVGEFDCDVWDVLNVELVTKIRTEHIDAAKAVANSDMNPDFRVDPVVPDSSTALASQGDGSQLQNAFDQSMQEASQFRSSLPPPPAPTITAADYFDSTKSGKSTHPDHVGRPLSQKVRTKSFAGKIWTTQNFPLSRDNLLAILSTIAPSSHIVQKIVDFLKMDLPPGFPVRLEVPILPMLTVQVTFQNFQAMANLDPVLFSLHDYAETDRVL